MTTSTWLNQPIAIVWQQQHKQAMPQTIASLDIKKIAKSDIFVKRRELKRNPALKLKNIFAPEYMKLYKRHLLTKYLIGKFSNTKWGHKRVVGGSYFYYLTKKTIKRCIQLAFVIKSSSPSLFLSPTSWHALLATVLFSLMMISQQLKSFELLLQVCWKLILKHVTHTPRGARYFYVYACEQNALAINYIYACIHIWNCIARYRHLIFIGVCTL